MTIDRVAELQKLVRSMQCVDLAPRLERGIPRFPTHPHLVIDPTITHARDGYYCQSLAMAEHTGCHCDVPAHIHADRMHQTVETIAADHFLAVARVYDFSSRDLRQGEVIVAQDILDYESAHGSPLGHGEIALVNFGWLKKHWHTDERAHFYARNQPGMDDSAARLFRDRGARAVGADTIACEVPIVDGVMGDDPGHGRHWLPNGILIIECMARLELLPRNCFLFAAPLPIDKGSGSPLRPLALF